ncbi:MAG: periplasmic trypsin-like serine protease DegP [Verrucomicrobiota bacterium]|jgi:serine protease Do
MRQLFLASLLALCACQQLKPAEVICLSPAVLAKQGLAEAESSVFFLEVSLRSGEDRKQVTMNSLALDRKGHLLCLYLPEADTEEVKVFIRGEEFPARIVKADKSMFYTILKIDTDLPILPVKFGEALALRSGDPVVGVVRSGRSLDYEACASPGTVRTVILGKRDLVLVDGFVSGNSAELPSLCQPLYDAYGRVVAIGGVRGEFIAVDAIADAARRFLVDPAAATRRAATQQGDPWLGFAYEPVSEDDAVALGLPREGILMTRVLEGSPAWTCGLRSGDVIVGVDGHDFTGRGIRAVSQLRRHLAVEVGRDVKVRWLRQGRSQEGRLLILKRPEPVRVSIEEFGLTVNEITPEDFYARQLFVRQGLVVADIEAGSPAATSSYFGKPLVSEGDVLLEVDGVAVKTVAELRTVLEGLRQRQARQALLKLQSGRTPSTVALDMSIGQKTRSSEVP